MRNAAFYHPVSSGIAKGGRGGATAPPIVPKQFSRKVKIRGGIVVGGGGVYSEHRVPATSV